jgi:dTDP-4-amino-4,6-dideoxygalactose transaminase
MDTILATANRHNLLVIEDAAQGVCSTYKGRYLGTIGDLATYSFHETKNLIAGEGGALVINNSRFLERAEIIRDKGTNRSQFMQGLVDKYTWVDFGSSYLASELMAAFLFAQLEESERISKKRREIFDYYMQGLRPLEERGYVRLPVTPADCCHNGHMFYVILESFARRGELISHLEEHGISAVFHYVPLHSSPMGERIRCSDEALPVTDACSKRLLRLPSFFELTHDQQDRVIESINAFFGNSTP